MIRIETKDFNIDREIAALPSGSAAGAVVTFTGQVRGEKEGRPLLAMELEHYPGMTEKQLAGLEAEARQRWPVLDCLIVHRIGRLKPGENIVLVIVTSAHREAAFQAARFLMDFLKVRATFWKKEIFAQGEEEWTAMKEDDVQKSTRWSGQSPEGSGTR